MKVDGIRHKYSWGVIDDNGMSDAERDEGFLHMARAVVAECLGVRHAPQHAARRFVPLIFLRLRLTKQDHDSHEVWKPGPVLPSIVLMPPTRNPSNLQSGDVLLDDDALIREMPLLLAAIRAR